MKTCMLAIRAMDILLSNGYKNKYEFFHKIAYFLAELKLGIREGFCEGKVCRGPGGKVFSGPKKNGLAWASQPSKQPRVQSKHGSPERGRDERARGRKSARLN